MYLDGRWYGLALPDGASRPEGVVESLDVSILQVVCSIRFSESKMFVLTNE